ncbi:MAG: DUF3857 domain-containing protein, partial [Novosphingobium sp.]
GFLKIQITKFFGIAAFFASSAATTLTARAGEAPLYQPSPAWITVAPLPESFAAPGDPGMHYDRQVRFEDGRNWIYFDSAAKITTPEILAQNSTISLPWVPDKGDIIIHELTLIRDGERIDLLGHGQKFVVLRREQTLEQRELTGILTATLAPEGMQVGDILRLRASITSKDEALGGRVQWSAPLFARPQKIGYAHMALSWPSKQPVLVKTLATGASVSQVTKGDYTELSIALPIEKQAEMPADAPARFNHAPLIEATTFSGWEDVSKTMAPLYKTDGGFAAGSPVAVEVAAIIKAQTDPEARAAAALRIVQDKIRYLAVQMNGGNYVPQPPDRTWTLRYGDCKAKTLLLLSMLRAMNIEAEPVLANIGLDDLVPLRQPSAGAFNHIFVRAQIGGQSLWLDGTGSGTRLPDIHDSPLVRNVLPLRLAGAGLEAITLHSPARPSADIVTTSDQSTSVDLPAAVGFSATLRGAQGQLVSSMAGQLGANERRQLLEQIAQRMIGEGQYAGVSMRADPEAANVTLTGQMLSSTPWKYEDRLAKQPLSRIISEITFAPDRARPAWTAIPVATGMPDRVRYRTVVKLPEQGRGITIEGDRHLAANLAGYDVARDVELVGGTVTVIETLAATGREIAADGLAAERDRVAIAVGAVPKLIAPADARHRWDITDAQRKTSSQMALIDAVYARAIADAEPTDGLPWANRASYLEGISDFKGAITDISKAITIAPSIEAYLVRSNYLESVGNFAASLDDAEAARKLDPSSSDAVEQVASVRAKAGNVGDAVALLDERIAIGGEKRFAYELSKAALLAEHGKATESVLQYNALIATKPGNADLLNGRCWAKALGQIELESALKDCTKAIELSSQTAPILDSRGVVWFRMGRYQEALDDIDAALLQVPGLAQSHYVRNLVLRRLNRSAEADKDLALARRLRPQVEAEYAQYGLK